MKRPHIASGISLLSFVLFVCLAPAASAQPAAGLIAFNSDRDGSDDLYVMNADGGDVRRLTNSDEYDYNATWSPDGQALAFTPYAKGARESVLSTVTLDGAPPKAILDARSYLASPAWSPDGSQIAYGAMVDDAFGIFAVNADGSNDHAMIAPSPNATVGSGDWIEDGSRILFNANGGKATMLKTADVDGGGATTIIDQVETQFPIVSPDGQKVAFGYLYSTLDFSAWQIYVANVDGSGLTLVTPNDYNNVHVAWSPDSQRLAFSSNRDGHQEIYVTDLDGSNQVNISHDAGNDDFPTWSPDGRQIAFQSDRDGNLEIYVMNADGTDAVNLTNHAAKDTFPVWQPATRK